ncbi:MAG: hypothetical protein U9Q15_00700 [Patescibacteria group bacterium]|nr:hypothetical protein [Patescibacteria group bacterium]
MPIANEIKEISPQRKNHVWVTDFSHLNYHGMKLYLWTILDAYTKEIIGIKISFRHTHDFLTLLLKQTIIKH